MSGEAVTIVSSRTDTATTSGTAGTTISGMEFYRKGNFALNISALTGTPTLAVVLQKYVNGYWTDMARFTDMTATGTRILHNVGGDLGSGTTTVEEAQLTGTITAQNMRAGGLTRQIRAYWVITGSITSLTWSVTAEVSS